MDLKPGIRVKIERAYFRTAMAGEDEYGAKTFLGLSTAYFDVELSSDNNTRFRQVGDIRYSPASLGRTFRDGFRDLELAGLPQERRYRLFFYSYLVAEKHERSAAIMGANNIGHLDKLDQELRAKRDKDCKNAEASGAVTCFAFDGFVTLSSQISVGLNGKTRFVEWGTQVKDVLPKALDSRTLQSLSIQRRFGPTNYYDVRFNPGDSSVLSLWLVGGDRLTWSKRLSIPASR